MTMPTPGTAAPAFTMDGDTGPISLGEFAGKKLVLYFYPKDDTPGCTNEGKAFSALKADFDAADTVVVGVSRDSVASHAKFRAKYGLTVLLGSDPGDVTEAYGTWVEKSMYGKKYMGMERTSFLIGADGKIKAIWRKVKPEAHAAQVMEAAAAL